MNIDPVTNTSEFGRIPEKLVKEHLVRSCAPKAKIVPKVITLSQLSSSIASQYTRASLPLYNVSRWCFTSNIQCTMSVYISGLTA